MSIGKRYLLYLLRGLWLILWLFCSGADAAPEPQVSWLVDQISGDSLASTVERMVAFETRFMGSDSNAAASRWLAARLETLGYGEVRFDTFMVNTSRRLSGRDFVIQDLAQWNVVAVKPGTLFRKRYVVLGAHYDTIALDMAPDSQFVAPGADDNGTGIAGLLEVARVLRGVELDATVVFALFGAEELGLVGSRDYVTRARARGDDILLMLTLDSIGTRSSIFPDAFTVDTIGPYLNLGEVVAQAAEDYTAVRARNGSGGRVLITSNGSGWSDHQSFIDKGYPGVGVLLYWQNPALHLNTSVDTLGAVDFALVEGITKAVLPAVLQLGGFPARSPDFDGDGQVAMTDFLLFVTRFGKADVSGDEARYDLDRDGRVGFSDFLLFAENFGRTLN